MSFSIEKKPKLNFKKHNKEIRMIYYSENDWIYKKSAEKNDFYEADLLDYIKYITKILKNKKDIFVDVGANIGNHSVYFGCFLADLVISIEPNPEVIPILESNILNNKVKAKIIKHGIGDTNSSNFKLFLDAINQDNIGGTKLIESSSDISPHRNILTKKLDDLLSELVSEKNTEKSISLIKIDVEGMEDSVLNSASKVLKKYKPEIFVEIQSIEKMNLIKEILLPLEYKPVVSWAETPVWHFTHEKNLTIKNIVYLKVYIITRKTIKITVKILKKIF